MPSEPPPLLDFVQHGAFRYFLELPNPANGLVADSTWAGAPASITAVGFALAAYAVASERGFVTRADAIDRTLATLRFFHQSPQGPEPDATGYHGFYYHFLDMQTGRRTRLCELSTIDTAYLIMGALVAAQYFDGNAPAERELRRLAAELYRRVDWSWALNGGPTLTHGWHPESGFIPHRWQGYDESLFMHVLALGSPTFPASPEIYAAWTASFQWRSTYGSDFLYAGPLFIHQVSHCWLDLRGIQDDYMHAKGIDYFENSRRATYAQHSYAIENPLRFAGYGPDAWGITASEGPGELTRVLDGVERRFYNYLARGVPGPDDGTLSPWVAVDSLPFAPELVLPAIAYYDRTWPQLRGQYGFTCSLNPTFTFTDGAGWFSKDFYGLNLGPNALMIENHRSDFIWRLTRYCPSVVEGLRRAGFRGGWLAAAHH